MIKSITDQFIEQYNTLKGVAFKNNKELSEALNYKSPNSITEITMGRQQIDPVRYKIFTEKYSDHLENTESVAALKKENGLLKQLVISKDKIIADKEEIINLLKMQLGLPHKKTS